MIDIYGTLGPACADPETLKKMFSLGMTGVRLNLSHMTLEEAAPMIRALHEATDACGIRAQLLVDLQGPELRIGRLKEPLTLTEGTAVRLAGYGPDLRIAETPAAAGAGCLRSSDPAEAGAGCPVIPVPAFLLPHFRPGQELLLDDGKILLRVTGTGTAEGTAEKTAEAAACAAVKKTEAAQAYAAALVLRGGKLSGRKSIAAPGLHIESPALTPADLKNIADAKKYGVTAVMQPFVRSRADLDAVRAALSEADASDIRIFAKIENLDGVAALPALIPAADEIVIARGDLGNAVPLWELPVLQKRIEAECLAGGTPFMVVTQMLASMEHSAVPTRAEVSDICNAILDGASSVMVTGETAVGEYPAEVIRYLSETALSALSYREECAHAAGWTRPSSPDSDILCVIMASGMGKRFGSNKLLTDFRGAPMFRKILDATEDLPGVRRLVVTRHPEIAEACRAAGIETVLHDYPDRDQAIRLALETAACSRVPGAGRPAASGAVPGAYLFCPADQPLLTRESLLRLLTVGHSAPGRICRLSGIRGPGSPVLFPAALREELLSLPEKTGGKAVLLAHPELVTLVPAVRDEELQDVDTPEDLLRI